MSQNCIVPIVGIGAAPPAWLGGAGLHVNGSVNVGVDVYANYFWSGTDNAGLEWGGGTDGYLGNGTAHSLALKTNNSTKMTVLSGGKVGIGTTTPGYLLDVNGTARATNFISTSDRRLKTNIHPIGGLSVVTKLNGVQFNWIKTGAADLGVIAQEVEAVLPDAVVTDANGYKAVKYPNLIAPLIESTKDLYGMCKATEETTVDHERRLAALESANKQLEATNSQLQATNLQLQGDNNALKARLDAIEQKLGLQK